MSDAISFFRAQIQNRRFTIETLQILESTLVANDVRSALETRSEIRDLLRAEIVVILREIDTKTVDEKLSVVDFLVKAFFIVGDVEVNNCTFLVILVTVYMVKSCLALRYEALVLRNARFVYDLGLKVSYEEWYTFAKDSFDNGFYSIAVKGFESALMCIQSHNNVDKDHDYIDDHVIDNIRKHRDMAGALVASHSVHTESANYLKRKAVYDEHKYSSLLSNKHQPASVTYRRGINERNRLKLQKSQGSLQNISDL